MRAAVFQVIFFSFRTFVRIQGARDSPQFWRAFDRFGVISRARLFRGAPFDLAGQYLRVIRSTSPARFVPRFYWVRVLWIPAVIEFGQRSALAQHLSKLAYFPLVLWHNRSMAGARFVIN